jgi:hypothetical protein
MANFPVTQLAPSAPPAGFLGAIQQAIPKVLMALSVVGSTFDKLTAAAQAAADGIENISSPKLFEATEDDEAIAAVNSLSQEGKLAILPTSYKYELMKRMWIGCYTHVDSERLRSLVGNLRLHS